jgi:hypothetical protein
VLGVLLLGLGREARITIEWNKQLEVQEELAQLL